METDLDHALDQPVGAPVAPVITNQPQGEPMKKQVVIGVLVLLVVAGIGTGWGLSRISGSGSAGKQQLNAAPGELSADQVVVGQVYGNDDQERFKDVSEGILASGGIDGEGTHHLIRPGGASQTVYLTSSVVDLDLFVNHKVQLRGETFSAQKAAWFMDVGSVKVMELNAQIETPDQTTEVPAE
jgi:hypothetical protein